MDSLDESVAVVEMGTATAQLGSDINDNLGPSSVEPSGKRKKNCFSCRICAASACGIILLGCIAVVITGICLYFLNKDKLCDMKLSFACDDNDDGSNQGDGTDGAVLDEPTFFPTASPVILSRFPSAVPTVNPSRAPTASPNVGLTMSMSSLSPLLYSPSELSTANAQGTPTSPYFVSDIVYVLLSADGSNQSALKLLNSSVSSLEATFSLVEANLTSVNPFADGSASITQFALTLDILNASVASFTVPSQMVAGNWTFSLNSSGIVTGSLSGSTVFLTINTRYGWDPSIAAPFLALSTVEEQLDLFQTLPVLANENMTLNFTELLDLPSLTDDWNAINGSSDELKAIMFAEIFASLSASLTSYDEDNRRRMNVLINLAAWAVQKTAVLYAKAVGCTTREALWDARRALGLPDPLTNPIVVHVTRRPTLSPTQSPTEEQMSSWDRFTNFAGKVSSIIRSKITGAVPHVGYNGQTQLAKEVYNGKQSSTLQEEGGNIHRALTTGSTYQLHCGHDNPLTLSRESQTFSLHSSSAVAANFPDETELITEAWTVIKAVVEILPDDVRNWLNLDDVEAYFEAMFEPPESSMFALQDSQIVEIVSNDRICTSWHESKVYCDCNLPQVRSLLATDGTVPISMTVTYTPVEGDETYTGTAYGILTALPTAQPTVRPTVQPTAVPIIPTHYPTVASTSAEPSVVPSTREPSVKPSPVPSTYLPTYLTTPMSCTTTGSFWHWNSDLYFRVWSCGMPYRYCHYEGEPDGCFHDYVYEPGVYGCLRVIDRSTGSYSCDGGMTVRRALMELEADDIWFVPITCECVIPRVVY